MTLQQIREHQDQMLEEFHRMDGLLKDMQEFLLTSPFFYPPRRIRVEYDPGFPVDGIVEDKCWTLI